MTRMPWRLMPPGLSLSHLFIHLPSYASENPTPQNTARSLLFVFSLRCLNLAFQPGRTTRHIRFLVFHHVPNNHRQTPHDGHAGDL